MFRMWCKEMKNNHLVKDLTVSDDDPDKNRTRKVLDALDACCESFNIGVPVWLDASIREFQRFDKVRFRANSFMEPIDFDYLEIHVIEED